MRTEKWQKGAAGEDVTEPALSLPLFQCSQFSFSLNMLFSCINMYKKTHGVAQT